MAEIDLQMKENNFMADHLFVTAAIPTRILVWEMDIKRILRICIEAKLLDVNIKFNHEMIIMTIIM